MTRMTGIDQGHQHKLQNALDGLAETTQDFTDSAYTSHQHREKIVMLCEKLRTDLQILIRAGLVSHVKFARKKMGIV